MAGPTRNPLDGLASEVVELPLTEGLANNFSKHFRSGPKEALYVAENVELTEVGKFKNRDGFVDLPDIIAGGDIVTGNLSGTYEKLFQHRKELGVIATKQVSLGSGAGWGGDGDTVLTYDKNVPAGSPTGGWKAHGKIPRPTLANLGNITPDNNIRLSDVCVSGNFAMIAWHTATQTDNQWGNIYFRVVDITNGTTIVDTTQMPALGTYVPGRTNTSVPAVGPNSARSAAGSGYQAKMQCVAVGNRYYVFLLACTDATAAPAGNDILGFWIDMGAIAPTVSATVLIAASVQAFGVTTDGTAIFISYVATAAPLAVRVAKLNTSLGSLGNRAIATLGGTEVGIYDINCSAGFGQVGVTCTTYRFAFGPRGVSQYVMACDTSNSLTTTGTALDINEASLVSRTNIPNMAMFRPDILVISSTDMVACVSVDDPVGLADCCLYWSLLKITAGSMTNVSVQGSSGLAFNFVAQGITNVAKLFLQAGRVFLPVAKTSIYSASGLNSDGGYFVVELDAGASQNVNDKYRLPMLVANWATDISAPLLDTNMVWPILPADYGPIMTASGGTTVVTLTSTTTLPNGLPSGVSRPVSIRIRAVTTTELQISYDEGVNAYQRILVSAATGIPFALTGPGEGFSITLTGGAVAAATVWTAGYLPMRQQALACGCVSGNSYYVVTRSGSQFGNNPTPLFSGYIIEAIALDFVDPYRWASRPAANLTVFGAAAMIAYDGRRTFEAGIAARPRICEASNNTGVLVPFNPSRIKPGVRYFFRAVTTWLDASGDRWFGAPSYASRNFDGYSAYATPYYTGNMQQLAAPTAVNVILGGILAAAVPIPILVTCTVAGSAGTGSLDISYDNGATVAQTVASNASGVALTGLGAGLTITTPFAIGVGWTWEALAQGIKLRVELPPVFSGMVSGVDYFKNSAEVWIFMTTADSVSTYFLAAQLKADQGAVAQYNVFQHTPVATVNIISEPSLSADQMYTAGGELENSPAPSARIIEAHRDRMLAISGYDNRVYYTKPKIAGRGLEWAQQTQYFEIPEDGKGLASNETCFMIFTTRGVYAVEGYGPSSTGQPANAFGTLQLISNQLGLYEVNSCRTTPVGVIFRTSQGWWLVDRTLSLQYIGEDIDGMVTTAATTTAISIDQRLACVRIMMSIPGGSGYRSYNYWYDSKRWSTDTSSNARAVTHKDAMVLGDDYFIIDDTHVLARSGTNFGTQYTDGLLDTWGHGPIVETGWITVANLAMLKRIWRVIAVVENKTAGLNANAGVSLTVYADWDDSTFVFNHFWTADVIGLGIQTLRAHMPKQKMKAIRIVLTSVANTISQSANNNPGYNFIGLGFQVGIKGRMSTEPVARST
jgi:hypothetical protein